jgi:hypothetical protein
MDGFLAWLGGWFCIIGALLIFCGELLRTLTR